MAAAATMVDRRNPGTHEELAYRARVEIAPYVARANRVRDECNVGICNVGNRNTVASRSDHRATSRVPHTLVAVGMERCDGRNDMPYTGRRQLCTRCTLR